MNLEQPSLSDLVECHKCGREQQIGYKFCNICGVQNLFESQKRRDDALKREGSYYQIWTYVLLTFGLLLIGHFLDDTLYILIGTTVLFAIIDIIFAVQGPQILQLFDFRRIDFSIALMVFVCCVGSGFIVYYGIGELNNLFFEDDSSYKVYFQNTAHPFIMAIVFIAIFPTIFEELAFRGFLFSNLKIVSNTNAALWGSTFLFAIAHFSILSLIWLIPFAYGLGTLRKKYNTLLYGIIGHFTHNATVVFLEFY